MGGALYVRDSITGEFNVIPYFIGPRGKSAYEIAVDHGFEGTEEEWLASLAFAPIYGDVRLEGDVKVITLNGNLEPGIYELRFDLANGKSAEIKQIEVV